MLCSCWNNQLRLGCLDIGVCRGRGSATYRRSTRGWGHSVRAVVNQPVCGALYYLYLHSFGAASPWRIERTLTARIWWNAGLTIGTCGAKLQVVRVQMVCGARKHTRLSTYSTYIYVNLPTKRHRDCWDSEVGKRDGSLSIFPPLYVA